MKRKFRNCWNLENDVLRTTRVKTHSLFLPVDRLEHGWPGQLEHGWAG